jgi:hypothetical protein
VTVRAGVAPRVSGFPGHGERDQTRIRDDQRAAAGRRGYREARLHSAIRLENRQALGRPFLKASFAISRWSGLKRA